jgi:photosystem II stability/assembly factor-like uncharacterized protein
MLLHLTGGEWSAEYSPTTPVAYDLKSVAVSASGSEVWAVGQRPMLLHLTGGKWSVEYTPTTNDLNGVALSASGSEGWAVGANATLLHLTAGTWSVVNSATPKPHRVFPQQICMAGLF